MSISVTETAVAGSAVIAYDNQLPGGSSTVHVVVANTGTGVARLSIGGRELVVDGSCEGCAEGSGDPADLLLVTIETGVDGIRWRGTPRELAATTADVGLVPAGSLLTLTISEELPTTVENASNGRLSMSLWFVMVDVADGTSDAARVSFAEVAGESFLRPVAGSGLALTGSDIGRLVVLGASLVAAGGTLLLFRCRE